MSSLNLALFAATGVYGLAPDRPSAPRAATPERPIPPRPSVCTGCWFQSCVEEGRACRDETCPCPCRAESDTE